MTWMVGAERTRLIESRSIRSGRPVGGRGQRAPDGPTHAINSATGKVACGFPVEALIEFDLDWESASLVERCPDCVRVVGAI